MRSVVAGFLTFAFASSCERPRTELIVRVDSELAWGVGATVQSVVLSVRRGGPIGPMRSTRITELGSGAGRQPLPLSVGVLPADDDLSTPVWIEALGCSNAAGCDRDTAVVAQRAVVRFVRGQTQEVTLLLASACEAVQCGSDERCATVAGRCEPATRAQDTVRTYAVDYDAAQPREAGATTDSVDAGAPEAATDLGADTHDGETFVDVPVLLDVTPTDVIARVDVVSRDDGTTDLGTDRPDAVDLGTGAECEAAATRACYTGNPSTRMVGLCTDGFQRCVGGRWATACNGEIVPAVETCNGIDDDCDRAVDNIATSPCYTGAPGTQGVGLCRAGTYRCVGSTRACAGQVVPHSSEVCGNRVDDNCNGMTDEGCATTSCPATSPVRWNIPVGTVGGPACLTSGGGYCEGTAYCSGGTCSTTPPAGCGGPFCATFHCNDETYVRTQYCGVVTECNGGVVSATGYRW